MYPASFNSPHRAPLDFNADRTDRVADAPGSEPCPRDPRPVSDLDTGALLAEIGLSAQAVCEVLTSSSDPTR